VWFKFLRTGTGFNWFVVYASWLLGLIITVLLIKFLGLELILTGLLFRFMVIRTGYNWSVVWVHGDYYWLVFLGPW